MAFMARRGISLKKSIFISLILLIFTILPLPSVLAESLVCTTCGKVLVGFYKEYIGKAYCSLECLGAALPQCSVCGKPAQKQIRAVGDTEKVYCSLDCYETTLPHCELCGKSLKKWVEVTDHKYCGDCANLPKCLNCQLPGADQGLADGRHICSQCLRAAIIDRNQAKNLFVQVRQDIFGHLKLKTEHQIQFYMIDAAGLAAIVGHRSFNEQGFYSYSGRYRTVNGVKSLISETYAIYILSALSPSSFRNTAAHELAHDLGRAFYPNVRKKEDVEGFAEYISSLMNSYWGNDSLNRKKLRNQEKDYANAYQKFLEIAEKNGLRDVMTYMEKQNR
jgi:hypothetical protein